MHLLSLQCPQDAAPGVYHMFNVRDGAVVESFHIRGTTEVILKGRLPVSSSFGGLYVMFNKIY